ncbi:MAG TPA: alpha/beta fold hydrolase [Solirubrobacteraceae bacterium]|nr:alpha/beta fold hydrolase [Solirubrobacteraceae bacterium]
MSVSDPPPVPPHDFPPARTVVVPDRGEFFLRDSGPRGEGGVTVLMLHGWLGSADLNFGGLYDDVTAAGYRIVAIDHRGHGRGPRPLAPFRLVDCAADAAGVVRTLGLGPVIVYGYSMGGAIAQLVLRDHADVVAGLVLSGTAQHWQEEELRRTWRAMPVLGLGLSLAPGRAWRAALRRAGFTPGPKMAWVHAEMTRHSARDIAEAGRELGRFDSRPWLRPPAVPVEVVLTSADEAVPPAKQRQLAAALGAIVREAPVRHLDVAAMAGEAAARRYNRVLLEALDAVRSRCAAETSGSLARSES